MEEKEIEEKEKEIEEIAEEWRKRLGIETPLEVKYNSGYQICAFSEKKYKKGPTIGYKLVVDPYMQLNKADIDKEIGVALAEEVIKDEFEAQRRVEKYLSSFEKELKSWLPKRFGIEWDVLLSISVRQKVEEEIAEHIYNLLKARAIP